MEKGAFRSWRPWSVIVLAALGAGCSSAPERNAVPEALVDEAQVPGISYARFWGDGMPADFAARIEAARRQIEADIEANPTERSTSFLALSGGGANGAFGAGLLVGWTAAGTRPEFRMVTGISTGALIAPFAFLGPGFDGELREVYTQITTADVVERRNLATAAFSDSLASTAPLKELIATYIDETVLAAIALEFYRGRSLLIGTTNLDAGRPVIWSIGAIAASGHPDALELIRSIMRASASIPGAFPPIYIEVEVDGERFDEMHVDGGTASQVFLYPASLDFRAFLEDVGLEGESRMYVIRNSRLEHDWQEIEPNLISIAGRSIATLIATQGIGDLYRIYLGARRDGIDYNLAYIPETFQTVPTEPFDPAYMQELFDLGYSLARDGYPWEKAPPGFEPPEAARPR